MSDKITVEALDLETLDADGAIRETEAAIDGDTRGETASARARSAEPPCSAAGCC